MMRFLKRAAGVTAVALSLVMLTGTALAGSGNGNSANAPGQEKKADAAQPQPAPSAPTADPAAQSQQPQQQSTPPGQAKKQDSQPAASQQSSSPGQAKQQSSSPGQAKQQARASNSTPGVKPSNSTSHNTSCTTGGSTSSVTCTGNGPKADSSKQYGNGKTAAQIAVSRGAPAGTLITGPGNSQPHKVVACGHKHAVDVHAIKSYSQADCTAKTSTPIAPVTVEQPKPLVPACGQTLATVPGGVLHHTGSAKHPYVLIHPSTNSAHYSGKHSDDIVVPAQQVLAANGDTCATPPAGTQSSQTSVCGPQTTTQQVSHQVVDGVWHKTGSKTHPYVLIHPSGNSAHLSGKHEDDIPNLVTVTETVQVTAAGTTTCSTETPVVTQVTTPPAPTVEVLNSTVTPNASAPLAATQGMPAAAAAPAQGGVLGATATIKPAKPHRGGVLGAATNVAGTSLPFTGFPLWIAVLIAVVLIGGGLMLRGRGTANRV